MAYVSDSILEYQNSLTNTCYPLILGKKNWTGENLQICLSLFSQLKIQFTNLINFPLKGHCTWFDLDKIS